MTKMSHWVWIAGVAALSLGVGCSTGSKDHTAGTDSDTGAPDSGNETDDTVTHTGDTGAPDTDTGDTGAPDTDTGDTGAPDTDTGDTGAPDTDTGDTGAPDTDTGSATNQPPSLQSVALVWTTSGLYNTSFVDCEAQASDPDGTTPTLTYSWTLEPSGQVLGSESGLKLTTQKVSPADTVRCTVTASDGLLSVSDSAEAVVENRPPELMSLAILSSTSGFYNDATELSCYAPAIDADGESLTTTWLWRNTTQNTILGATEKLQLSDAWAQPGDSIACEVSVTDGVNTISGDVSRDVINRKPVLSYIAVTPSAASIGDTVVCTVTASDPDHMQPQVSTYWRFVSSPTPIATGDSLYIDPQIFAPGDSIACMATADDGALTAQGSAVVSIENMPPVIGTPTITPAQAFNDSTLQCSAQASDPEGQSLSFQYTWRNITQNRSVGASSETLVLTAALAKPGDVIGCRVAVSDGSQSAESESSLTLQNRPPEVTSAQISPEPFYVSSLLSCTAQGSDPDGTDLSWTYTWTNKSRNTELGQGATLQLTSDLASAGDLLACEALGSDGELSTSREATARVEDRPPEVSTPQITPLVVYNTSEVLCSATGTDVDGQDVTLSWAWTLGLTGEPLGSGATLQLTPALVKPGDILTCEVTAHSGGLETTASASTVVLRREPTVKNTHITASSPYNDATLTCTADTSAPDNPSAEVSIEWTLMSTGLSLGQGQSLTLSGGLVMPGDRVGCTVTLDDGTSTATGSDSVEIANRKPELSTPIITPGNAYLGASLTCSATATDADGETLALSYTWYNESQSHALLGSDPTLQLTPSMASVGDQIACVAVAADALSSVNASVIIAIQDNVPRVYAPQITPSVAYNDTELTCEAHGSMPDGTPLPVTYTWTDVTSAQLLGSGASLQLTSALVQPGHEIRCTAEVSHDGQTQQARSSIVLSNRAPSVDAVSISPEAVGQSDLLTCSAIASDPDDSAISTTYTWKNATTGASMGTGATLQLSPLIVAVQDQVSCTAQVSDGSLSAQKSASVIISGPGLGVTVPVITPSQGVFNDATLTCSATASDTRGGSPVLGYVWTNTTQNQVLGASETLVLSPTSASPSDQITCVATATLGPDHVSSSASVTVGDRPPVLSDATLTPSVAYNTDVLTCAAAGSDPDVSGPLPVTYQWKNITLGEPLDSSDVLSLNPTRAAPGSILSCTATVTSHGITLTKEARITLGNRLPEISNLRFTPAGSPLIGSTLSCAAQVSDPDGESPYIAIAWLNQTRNIVLGSGASLTLSADLVLQNKIMPGETLACTFTAYDSAGSTTQTITIPVDNRAPSVQYVAIEPGSPYVGDNVLCSVGTADPDGTTPQVSYVWTNETQQTTLSTHASFVLTRALALPGDVITCTVEASDGYATATGTESVQVQNRKPLLSNVFITPSAAFNDSELSCQATATDADGDPIDLTYQWVNESRGGIEVGTGQTLQLDVALAKPNEFIACIPSASDGVSSVSGYANLKVIPRKPSVSTTVVQAPNPFYNDSTLTCIYQVQNPDALPLETRVSWINGRTSNQFAEGESVTLSPVVAKPQDEIKCVVEVSDGTLHDGEMWIVSQPGIGRFVGNRAPIITNLAYPGAVGGSLYNSAMVECTADITDPDGDETVATWGWKNLTRNISLGANPVVQFDASIARPGDVVRCELSVADGFSGHATANLDTTIGNRLPVVTPHGWPADLYNDSIVSCGLNIVDPDDPQLTQMTTTRTFVNATTHTVLGTSSSLQLHASMAVPFDEIRCEYNVFDGTGSTTGSVGKTLGNRAPVLYALDRGADQPGGPTNYSLTEFYIDMTFACRVTAGDLDKTGLTVSYTWYRLSTPETPLATITHTDVASDPSPFNVVDRFAPAPAGIPIGEGVACEAIVDDGTQSMMQTVVFAITNRVPVISDLTLTPRPAHETSTLTCDVQASDPDGEALTYIFTWRNLTDDVTLPGAVTSGHTSTLDLTGAVSEGDRVQCSVEVKDPHTDLPPGPNDPPPPPPVIGTITAAVVGPNALWPPVALPADDLLAMQSALTVGQYFDLMGYDSNLSPTCTTDDCPANGFTYYDALSLANEASGADGLDACYTLNNCTNDSQGHIASCTSVTQATNCTGWRLPTANEWQSLAKAGQNTTYAGSNNIDEVAWYGDTTAYPRCGKAPNAYGLCDMSGNVAEMVYGSSGVGGGSRVTVYGGAYGSAENECKTSSYTSQARSATSESVGLRLVRANPTP